MIKLATFSSVIHAYQIIADEYCSSYRHMTVIILNK